MFETKKKKIRKYLDEQKTSGRLTVFDKLLSDWVSGELKAWLLDRGLTKLEIHTDWLADYQCINIQGKRDKYFIDIQVEPGMFAVAWDKDEPDNPTEHPLVSAAHFYDTVRQLLESMQ